MAMAGAANRVFRNAQFWRKAAGNTVMVAVIIRARCGDVQQQAVQIAQRLHVGLGGLYLPAIFQNADQIAS